VQRENAGRYLRERVLSNAPQTEQTDHHQFERGAMNTRLLDVEDSVLCVIDVQPGFVGKLEKWVGVALVQRVVWIAALARVLSVPILVTEEEANRNGSTVPDVITQVGPDLPRRPKPIFGLADVPEILADVQTTERHTAVLVGCETDVCVAQSALGLLDRGYRAVAVVDAVASPDDGHERGLARMRDAGAVLVGTKGLFYEWVRTVDRAWTVSEVLASVPVPEGLTL
jgi:nicotinamidase-related amidase